MPIPFLLTEDGQLLLTELGFPILCDGLWEIPLFPSWLAQVNAAYPIAATPNWSTLRQKAVSGKETALGTFANPTKSYELSTEVLRETLGSATNDERRQLEDFIDEINGAVFPFYYDDPDDDLATKQLFCIGDGTTRDFQLCRALIDNGFSTAVQSPVPHVDPTIYVDDVATTAFTLGAAGKITFDVAPTAGAVGTWSGSYYWLCRFDEDSIALSKDMSWIWSAKKIPFSMVPL